MTAAAPPKVYRAITLVQKDLCEEGIAKGRRNQQQNYSFRGIDDVFNALGPLLAKHGLCVLPRVLSRQQVERETSKGSILYVVVVEVEFVFVASEDGSSHIVKTFGEAMDSADKATNKAMSAAYKYAALQAFAIPTEGDNDADATTPPETVSSSEADGIGRYREVAEAMKAAKTMAELEEAGEQAKHLTAQERKTLTPLYAKRRDALQAAEDLVPQDLIFVLAERNLPQPLRGNWAYVDQGREPGRHWFHTDTDAQGNWTWLTVRNEGDRIRLQARVHKEAIRRGWADPSSPPGETKIEEVGRRIFQSQQQGAGQ